MNKTMKTNPNQGFYVDQYVINLPVPIKELDGKEVVGLKLPKFMIPLTGIVCAEIWAGKTYVQFDTQLRSDSLERTVFPLTQKDVDALMAYLSR